MENPDVPSMKYLNLYYDFLKEIYALFQRQQLAWQIKAEQKADILFEKAINLLNFHCCSFWIPLVSYHRRILLSTMEICSLVLPLSRLVCNRGIRACNTSPLGFPLKWKTIPTPTPLN